MIKIHSITSEPRILFWDVETAKMILRMEVYQLKQYSKYLPHTAIERDIWMPCAAWKWKGQDHTSSVSVLKSDAFDQCYWDDFIVIDRLHKLMHEADIIVAHNGDNFDWKMLNVRCVSHGLTPPPKPMMIDTLKIARREFRFASNSLRYLAEFLGVEDKGNSPDWSKVSSGDREAIEYCERYCRQDIRTLEGVFYKLLPYATNLPNINTLMDGVHHNICPSCGHWDLEARGYRYTKAGKYQRHQCRPQTGGCGSWSQSKKNLKKVDIR
jgi:DNA polymerase elongation subunit (family B)